MFKKEPSELDKLKAEYRRLKDLMNDGVGREMELNWRHTPRKLRYGLNSAHAAHAAVVRLLLDKGVITEQEYWGAQVDAMRHEVDCYEERLSSAAGKRVTLG